MFDIGALELILVGVVALIVVGPQRLPKLARTAGLWLGRGKRALQSVKEEIDREIKSEELKEILEKQASIKPLESIIEEGSSVIDETGNLHQPSNSATTSSPEPPAIKDSQRSTASGDAP